jgi:hypothetical protein
MSKYIHKTNINNPATWLKPDEKLMCGQYDVAWMYVIFADVDGYEGYKVDSEGKVWSQWEIYFKKKTRGHRARRLTGNWVLLDLTIDKRTKYIKVGLRRNGKQSNFFVHQLVLSNLYRKRNGSPHSRHLNRNRNNNRLVNLMWGTVTENTQDRIRSGRSYVGSGNPKSKFSDDDVRQVIRDHASGTSKADIARKFKTGKSIISDITNGNKWNHITGIPKR